MATVMIAVAEIVVPGTVIAMITKNHGNSNFIMTRNDSKRKPEQQHGNSHF